MKKLIGITAYCLLCSGSYLSTAFAGDTPALSCKDYQSMVMDPSQGPVTWPIETFEEGMQGIRAYQHTKSMESYCRTSAKKNLDRLADSFWSFFEYQQEGSMNMALKMLHGGVKGAVKSQIEDLQDAAERRVPTQKAILMVTQGKSLKWLLDQHSLNYLNRNSDIAKKYAGLNKKVKLSDIQGTQKNYYLDQWHQLERLVFAVASAYYKSSARGSYSSFSDVFDLYIKQGKQGSVSGNAIQKNGLILKEVTDTLKKLQKHFEEDFPPRQ